MRRPVGAHLTARGTVIAQGAATARISGIISDSSGDFESHFRIVLPDGPMGHIRNIGHPKLIEAGDAAEFVGTAIDVTESKEAEKKTQKSGREARQLPDLSPLHVMEPGPDGTRVYNNPEIGRASMFEEIEGTSGIVRETEAFSVGASPKVS